MTKKLRPHSTAKQPTPGGEPFFLPLRHDCNQNCIFCSSPNGRLYGETPAEWLRFLDGFKGDFLQISGGEPLLRDITGLLALLKRCAQRGICVELQTNGSLLCSLPPKGLRALALLVKKTGGNFNINFPAHNAATDKKITGLDGGFAARLAGLRALRKNGAAIRLTHIINRANYKALPDFAKFCVRELGGRDMVQFSFAKATGRAANRKVTARYEEVAPYLNRALAAAEKSGLNYRVDYIPLCYIQKFLERHIDWDKAPQKTSGPHTYEKKKPASCAGCGLFVNCLGPRLDYLRLYPGFTPPRVPAGRKPQAPASTRQGRRP